MIKRILNWFRFLRYIKRGGVYNVSLQTISDSELLKDKVCVVTGGGKGLGYAISSRMLSTGAVVIAVGSNEKRLEEAKSKLNSDKFFYYCWDLSDITDIEKRINDIVSLAGRIDVWINNAARVTMESTPVEFDKTIGLNVKSLLYISDHVACYYKNNKIRGKMVNISSLNSVQGGLSPYYISKHAVNCITEGLAKKYLDYGIIVNGVAPGYLPASINYTDVSDNAFFDMTGSKRYGMLEEIAELVLFLSTNRSNCIVGQTIICDGGITLR